MIKDLTKPQMYITCETFMFKNDLISKWSD